MGVRRAAPETHDAQAALRRGQGQGADRSHFVLAQRLQQRGKGSFLLDVIQDKRLLRFPDPSGGSFSQREFASGAVFPGHFGFEDMQAHDVAHGIVQDQVQVFEFHDAMQAFGEFVEQFAEIAVLRDRFGYFQQRLVARFRGSAGQFASGKHRS